MKDREDVGPTDQATVGEVLKVTAKPSFVTGAAVKGRKIRPVTWAVTESGRGPVKSCPPPPTRVVSTVAEPASSPAGPEQAVDCGLVPRGKRRATNDGASGRQSATDGKKPRRP